VVRRFLESTPVDLVVITLNASQIDRQLRLALQVRQLGLPALVLLNMADEARRFGVGIDLDELARRLELPVLLISAKYRQGLGQARHAIAKALSLCKSFFVLAIVNGKYVCLALHVGVCLNQ
jgi:ferrous iron transport protein B